MQLPVLKNENVEEMTLGKEHSEFFLKFFGGCMMMANKVRHSLQGYKKPRLIDTKDYESIVTYDKSVVDSYEHWLKFYLPDVSFENKNILELGPGADLGVASILLAKGVARYSALDAHNLLSTVDKSFYDYLLSELKKEYKLSEEKWSKIADSINSNLLGDSDAQINYVADPKFDVSSLKLSKSLDIILSHAAFEHFSDVDKLFISLDVVVKKGTVLIAQVDLQTHSRIIKDMDPNNIYRFSKSFYKLCSFSGSPNRLRPEDYASILEKNGWKNIRVVPIKMLSKNGEIKWLNTNYKNNDNMDILVCMLLAQKK